MGGVRGQGKILFMEGEGAAAARNRVDAGISRTEVDRRTPVVGRKPALISFHQRKWLKKFVALERQIQSV